MSTIQIKCPSCGAPIDLERGQHIIRCPYCNCDVALDKQARKAVEAEAILGFPYAAVTEDELQSTALLWISKAENMPLDFSKEACFSRCVLYYAPVYIQDIHYSASYQAQIGINQTHAYTEFNKGKRYRRHETITNWRLAKGDVEGDAHIFAFGSEVSRIPGIEQVTAGRIGYIGHETIEPQALYPMDIGRATIIPMAEPSAEEIESKLDPFIQKEVYKALSGDKQKNVRWNLKKKIRKKDCVYVPLWSVVFTYKGSDYSFIIDGCVPTEIYGIRPQDVSTQQAIKQAFIPAKATLWAGIASFVLALIFHTATLNILGALLLIGAVVFYLAAKRKARLLKQPGAELQEKLQLLYSDSTLTLQEKQTRAVRLVDEAYAAIVEQATAIPSTAGGKKLVRLPKKVWILSLGTVFVMAAFYLALSSSKSHSASDMDRLH